jgi:hypothetical protein
MGQKAMAVLRFREAAEEAETGELTMWRAINSDRMSIELTEDGAPNSSLPWLPTPTEDLEEKLAAADAAISGIEEMIGKVRTSQNELRQSLDDLKRERDEWRGRAERQKERPRWRRLAG